MAKALSILLVDDEVDLLDVLADVFEDEGHQVTKASSGVEALAVCSTQSFDVIFTDRHMPQMAGEVLAEKLCDTGVRCPFVFVSGAGATSDDYQQLQQCLADPGQMLGVVAKPFDENELLELLERI